MLLGSTVAQAYRHSSFHVSETPLGSGCTPPRSNAFQFESLMIHDPATCSWSRSNGRAAVMRASCSSNRVSSNSSSTKVQRSSRWIWPWSLLDDAGSNSSGSGNAVSSAASSRGSWHDSSTTASILGHSRAAATMHQRVLRNPLVDASQPHAPVKPNSRNDVSASINSTSTLQTVQSDSCEAEHWGSWGSALHINPAPGYRQSDDNSNDSNTAPLDGNASKLFFYDVMTPSAAAKATTEPTAPSSISNQLALLLADLYPQRPQSSDGGPSAAWTAGSPIQPVPQRRRQQQQTTQGFHHQAQHSLLRDQPARNVWGLHLGTGASTVPMPNASTLQKTLTSARSLTGSIHNSTLQQDTLQSCGPFSEGLGTSTSNGGVVSSRGDYGGGSSSNSSSSSDADWLTAVLSDPTSRLSSHSNTVLTNSLKRLASWRNAPKGAAAGSSAASAAVVNTEGLLDSILRRFGTFQLAQFEEVALQLSQLGYTPEAEWLAAFDKSSMAAMPGGSPRLLSRLLLSRSKLGGPASSEWCAACCQHIGAAPRKLSVGSWANALHGLVRLKHIPSRQFQLTFFMATAERLDDISPELLANLVWSLSRLKFAPSYMWWRSLVRAAASVEKPFTHAQLASLIHSIALWAEPGGIAAPDVQVLVDMLQVEVRQQLGVLQPAELTLLLWSVGSLVACQKLRLNAAFQDDLLAAIQAQLPRLNPAQCYNLCWGLAKLKPHLPDGFSEALLLEVQAQLYGFSNSNLCSVLWALARLDLVPLAPFRQQLWEQLHLRSKLFSPQDLSTLLWALAHLQLQPPADILHDLCDSSTPHLASCDTTHLTNIIWGLGRLQARPEEEWLEAAEEASLQVLPSANLTQVVNLVWGLTHLSIQGTSARDNVAGMASFSSSHDGAASSFPSTAWQATCLRELRLRCMCAGHDVTCQLLVQVLRELGVQGLHEAAAGTADRLFEEQEDEAACALQFQPGCH